MAQEVMHRKAADNEYFHQDFHGAISTGIEYLQEKYGAEAVREYLRQYVDAFHAPLKTDLAQRGLVALKEYFERIYKTERADFEIDFSEDEMILKVAACPAVSHMRANNMKVARLFNETTKTVNEQICAGSEFKAELVEYDEQTGKSVQKFCRRQL